MSIALDAPRGIGSFCSGASCGFSIFHLAEDDGGEEIPARKDGGDSNVCSSSLSSSSSIGRNSDLSGRSSDDEKCGENEVQSSYKGPLDMMESLEEVLPMRRGISTFYRGKSKSYTSLAEAASSSSVKDIAKPENAYTRKRRSQLALNLVWDKNRSSTPFRSNGGGISKRPISSNRSLLAMAVAITSSESNGSEDSSNSRSPPPRPPLHPKARISKACLAPSVSPWTGSFSTWRSYSLADLNQVPTHL